MAMVEDMRQSWRAWTRTIEKAETSHWKHFIDEAGEENYERQQRI
jgi:hypothetical protein